MKKYFSLLSFIPWLLVTMACGSGEPANPTANEGSENPNTFFVEVSPDDVISADGYSMVVEKMIDPTEHLPSFSPKPNTRTLALYVTFKNDSNETPFDAYLVGATLLASDGIIYGTHAQIVADELETVKLGPGEETNGWIGFVIAAEARPMEFLYVNRSVRFRAKLSRFRQ